MKRFLKCVCLVLSLSLLLSVPVRAAETPNTRASNFFTASSVYLYRTTGSSFQAWFEVTCKRTMDQVGAKEIKIQRSEDNVNWSTVYTFRMDDHYSTLICEDTAGHMACVNYTGSHGCYYRAYYNLYAKDETGIGTWGRYSEVIYID